MRAAVLEFDANVSVATGRLAGRAVTGSRRASTFVAAFVNSAMRRQRLAHLGAGIIIGSHVMASATGKVPHDIILLAKLDYLRACGHLATPAPGATLEFGGFQPAYAPVGAREVIVPAGTENPRAFAHAHFGKLFGLDGMRPDDIPYAKTNEGPEPA